MPSRIGFALKRFITRRVCIGPSRRFHYANSLLAFGQWWRGHAAACPCFEDRAGLYTYLQKELLREAAIDYLEFGVYRGETIGLWSSINRDPASRFVGFDSFEGLPEAWENLSLILPSGTFNTGGNTPDVQDARIAFVKGWFQDTVPGYCREFEVRNRLVVHCDADLYSSSMFVLSTLNPQISKGTIILFDEFDAVTHEFRAFTDYCSAFRRTLVPLAFAGPFFNHAAFEVKD